MSYKGTSWIEKNAISLEKWVEESWNDEHNYDINGSHWKDRKKEHDARIWWE